MRKSKKISELEKRITDLKDHNADLVDLILTQKAEIADLEDKIDTLETMRTKAYNDEPPIYSIVMDEDGLAWQRCKSSVWTDGWYFILAATEDEVGECVPWAELNLRYGPITVLHKAKKDNDDAS